LVCRDIGARDLERGLCIAVVREARGDESGAARMGARDTHRELIGFAARAAEHREIEFFLELARQALGVIKDVVVQVARMRIQGCNLP
jgi:hypothetical protein